MGKIGAVVVGVTLYAVVYTLFPLPALLMTLGPCGHDFKSLQDLVKRFQVPEQPESHRPHTSRKPKIRRHRSELDCQRRFVLNMPSRGMSECVELDGTGLLGVAASRTKITLTG